MPKGEQTEGRKKDGRLDFFGNRAIKHKWTFERHKTRFFKNKKGTEDDRIRCRGEKSRMKRATIKDDSLSLSESARRKIWRNGVNRLKRLGSLP